MATMKHIRDAAANRAFKRHRPEDKDDPSELRPGDEDYEAHMDAKSKTREGEEDFTGHKDQDSHTRPGEEDYTGHKGDESKSRPGDKDYDAHKDGESKTRPGEEDFTGHKGDKSKTHEGKDFEPEVEESLSTSEQIEDEFDEDGNLIPSGSQKDKDQRMLDQITGMGPDRSKSLYALAEKLLGAQKS